VVAASAGNHAQGLLSPPPSSGSSTIVMPRGRPRKADGDTILLEEKSFSSVETPTRPSNTLKNCQDGKTLIHPFDDGNSGCRAGNDRLEVLGGAPDLDGIVVPVGGAGSSPELPRS